MKTADPGGGNEGWPSTVSKSQGGTVWIPLSYADTGIEIYAVLSNAPNASPARDLP